MRRKKERKCEKKREIEKEMEKRKNSIYVVTEK